MGLTPLGFATLVGGGSSSSIRTVGVGETARIGIGASCLINEVLGCVREFAGVGILGEKSSKGVYGGPPEFFAGFCKLISLPRGLLFARSRKIRMLESSTMRGDPHGKRKYACDQT